jgi:cytochrome b6-f complex iron-sulfur subunit
MAWYRRRFLRYMAGSTCGTLALGWLAACSTEDTTASDTGADSEVSSEAGASVEGVPATDESGTAYTPDGLLETAAAGDRILAQGLAEPVFFVITDGPELADTAISSVCPHRQCVVDWDAEAQAFICPCHGSEFDSDGKVTNGPATTDLEAVVVTVTAEEILLGAGS